MSHSKKGSPAALILGVVALVVVATAFIKRDTIAGLILKGGDVSLVGESAKSSPQAKIAVDFLTALRVTDMIAITQLTTVEQTARIQQEARQPTPEYQEMTAMMLADLPADPTELQGKIKSVQTHKSRCVVTFETKANSWFVTMDQVNGAWKVAAF